MQSNSGKWIIIISVVLAVLISSYPVFAEKNDPDGKKVALVNGSAITQTDLDHELIVIKQRFREQGRVITDAQLKEINKAIVETLINRELLFQQSKKVGITVKEEDILNQLIRHPC